MHERAKLCGRYDHIPVNEQQHLALRSLRAYCTSDIMAERCLILDDARAGTVCDNGRAVLRAVRDDDNFC
ncbi:hypothetical protein D3C84_1207130 [compost metagenome]